MPTNYPNDEDGDALRRVATDSDMSKPMDIDFFVAAPTEAAALAVADVARNLGYRTTVERNTEMDGWTTYCTRTMLATYENVIAAQHELEQLARPYGASTDGWGTAGNLLAGPA